MDGEHFIDIYGSGHTLGEYEDGTEEQAYDGYLNAGYVVWSEFIAQYYTLVKTESRAYRFRDASGHIFDLLQDVDISTFDESKGSFSQACAYWLTCRDASETLNHLKNDPVYFVPDDTPYGKEAKAALSDCLEFLSEQIQLEEPWKISEPFIAALGTKFNAYRFANSMLLGVN